jgi:hypothetical protein
MKSQLNTLTVNIARFQFESTGQRTLLALQISSPVTNILLARVRFPV